MFKDMTVVDADAIIFCIKKQLTYLSVKDILKKIIFIVCLYSFLSKYSPSHCGISSLAIEK